MTIEERVLAQIRAEEVAAFLQELIRAESVTPPGDTRNAAKVCLRKLSQAHIPCEVLVPPPDPEGKRDTSCMCSVLGRIGNGRGPTVLLNAHIDTVELGDRNNWDYDPLGGEIVNGMLYGRGAGDDKGSVAAQIMAAVALQRADAVLNGTVLINPVADEEDNSRSGTFWLKQAGYLRPDMVIIGEQTENQVACAERAIVLYKVGIHGRSCHAAMPWRGINATAVMADFISRVNHELLPKVQAMASHPYLPPTTISTTAIFGGSKAEIIPEHCALDIDCRLCPGVEEEWLKGEFEKILEELLVDQAGFTYDVQIAYSEGGTATNTPVDDPLITALLSANERVTGQASAPTGYCQASDGRIFSSMGIPIAIFGPGDPGLAHGPNECVSVEQLEAAAKTLALALLRLLG